MHQGHFIAKNVMVRENFVCWNILMAMIMMMVITRRHLARKHSTNYKCAKEGCDKTFAKQYQVIFRYWYWCRDIEISISRYIEILRLTFTLFINEYQPFSVWRSHETPHAPILSHVWKAVQEEAKCWHSPDGSARPHKRWPGYTGTMKLFQG